MSAETDTFKAITASHVRKIYETPSGAVEAVAEADFEIARGDFVAILGPSGCGKSTLMLMIAGLEAATSGTITLDGLPVSGPQIDAGMMFQDPTLLPWRSVLENVLFPIDMRGAVPAESRVRAESLLRMVDLWAFRDKRPRELSGGMRQRVALARALVNRPAALLLGEPLGALDVKLRKHMQLELKRIQHELGTTFVYVTHDQEEALAMSDRIAVMNRGQVEQLGTPREIYEHPRTAFVADFIGSLNALELTIDELVGEYSVTRLGDDERVVAPASGRRVGDAVRVGVRPEHVQMGTDSTGQGSRLTGTIAQVVYLGMYTQFHVDTRAGRIVSHRLADESAAGLEAGSPVTLTWSPEHASFL